SLFGMEEEEEEEEEAAAAAGGENGDGGAAAPAAAVPAAAAAAPLPSSFDPERFERRLAEYRAPPPAGIERDAGEREPYRAERHGARKRARSPRGALDERDVQAAPARRG